LDTAELTVQFPIADQRCCRLPKSPRHPDL
jgi:hypothetical protein